MRAFHQREEDWLSAARRAASATGADRKRFLAEAERLTEQVLVELRSSLEALLHGELAAIRLDYVFRNAAAEDRAQDFPRTLLPAFQTGHDREAEAWAEFEASRFAAATLPPVDGFLALCCSLALYCSRCRDQYQEREAGLARLRDQLAQAGLSLKGFATLADDAGKAVSVLASSGLSQQPDWSAFAMAAAELSSVAKRVLPPESWDRAPGKPYETELGHALVHAFVRIGFNGKSRTHTRRRGAIFASAIAARHGFALPIKSLTSYASKLET